MLLHSIQPASSFPVYFSSFGQTVRSYASDLLEMGRKFFENTSARSLVGRANWKVALPVVFLTGAVAATVFYFVHKKEDKKAEVLPLIPHVPTPTEETNEEIKNSESKKKLDFVDLPKPPPAPPETLKNPEYAKRAEELYRKAIGVFLKNGARNTFFQNLTYDERELFTSINEANGEVPPNREHFPVTVLEALEEKLNAFAPVKKKRGMNPFTSKQEKPHLELTGTKSLSFSDELPGMRHCLLSPYKMTYDTLYLPTFTKLEGSGYVTLVKDELLRKSALRTDAKKIRSIIKEKYENCSDGKTTAAQFLDAVISELKNNQL